MSLGLDNLHSRYVYRVLRPDEDPSENLTCKDPYSIRSIAQHVESGLRIPSKYISTTSSFEKAKKWLETANEQTSWKYKKKRTTIVSIDVSEIKSNYPKIAKSAIDLTEAQNRNYFLETEKQEKFACAYQEVMFVKCIPSEVVTVVYMKDRYERQESIISRPPHSYSLHNNIRIYNQVSAKRKLGRDTETDDYPSLMNRVSLHNTSQPYTNRSTSQSTSPKSLDDDPLLIIGCCIMGSIIVVLIVSILGPPSISTSFYSFASSLLTSNTLLLLLCCCCCCCCSAAAGKN